MTSYHKGVRPALPSSEQKQRPGVRNVDIIRQTQQLGDLRKAHAGTQSEAGEFGDAEVKGAEEASPEFSHALLWMSRARAQWQGTMLKAEDGEFGDCLWPPKALAVLPLGVAFCLRVQS
jgi:hypothetical protein